MQTTEANEPDGRGRRETIAAVIDAEFDRQAQEGERRIDVGALASAIEAALSAEEPVPPGPDQGKRPDELNATNDD